MYLDKLEGRVDGAFFDGKAAERRGEQDKFLRSIQDHQAANQTYLAEGVRLRELAHRAHELFLLQEPRDQSLF